MEPKQHLLICYRMCEPPFVTLNSSEWPFDQRFCYFPEVDFLGGHTVCTGCPKKKLALGFSVTKATLESQMSIRQSVRQSQKPLGLSESLLSTIEPINHQAYWPSSLLTIEPIDYWAYWPSSLSTIKPIDLWSSFATFKSIL